MASTYAEPEKVRNSEKVDIRTYLLKNFFSTSHNPSSNAKKPAMYCEKWAGSINKDALLDNTEDINIWDLHTNIAMI